MKPEWYVRLSKFRIISKLHGKIHILLRYINMKCSSGELRTGITHSSWKNLEKQCNFLEWNIRKLLSTKTNEVCGYHKSAGDSASSNKRRAAFIYHKTQNVLRMIFSKCRYIFFSYAQLSCFSYESSKWANTYNSAVKCHPMCPWNHCNYAQRLDA